MAETKERWLELSEKFAAQGDFQAMKACANEILELNAADADGYVVQAEAALYMQDLGVARAKLKQAMALNSQQLRGKMVEGLIYGAEFVLSKEIPLLRKVLSAGSNLYAEEQTEYIRSTLEKTARFLADAENLAGEPDKAAEHLFLASRLAKEPLIKADLYSKALFLTNYREIAVSADLQQHEGYNAFFRAKVTYPHMVPKNGRTHLRIGYLSADFRQHAMAYFLWPFLHDYTKAVYEVFVYNAGGHDEITNRFKRCAVNWVDIQGMSPKEAARQIYKDKIDILVDFTGHTQSNCLPVLAYKPAPVQMSGLGYRNTTGLKEVDYFLSDDVCLPAGEKVRGFSEEILRLPDCQFCYQPDVVRTMPAPAAVPPYEKNGYVTFGCFNNFTKVTTETLLLWRAILERLPKARLLLKAKLCSIPEGKKIITERLRSIGIDMKRVEMRPFSRDYLEQYAAVDIALDTMPYTGGLTTCEALYMGVPLITLAGYRHGERFSSSILQAIGHEELVAESDMEYVNKAVHLAKKPELIKEYRCQLRADMQKSSLMDGWSYMQNIENLYQAVWQKYCQRK